MFGCFNLVLLFLCLDLANGYLCSEGACRVTSHAFKKDIDDSLITYDNKSEILEWHFHVYFFQSNNDSIEAALNIQSQLISLVKSHQMLVVLDGVTDDMLPGLNVSTIPSVHYGPVGPHPCGSYEVWVSAQYVAQALSWFMLNRGELTILFHPLTVDATEDHFGRVMWIGPPYRIDYTVLDGTDLVNNGSEYNELGLGYNYDPNSIFAPANWLTNQSAFW